MRSIIQTCFLFGLLGFLPHETAAQELAPLNVPGAKTIDVAEAKSLLEDGAIIIDLRMESDYSKGHLPTAISMNAAGVFSQKLLEETVKDKTRPIVFYCYGPNCMRSFMASTRAVSWGFDSVNYFRGGIPSWMAAGLPVEKK